MSLVNPHTFQTTQDGRTAEAIGELRRRVAALERGSGGSGGGSASVVDATTTVKGKLKLAGHLAGTADTPILSTTADPQTNRFALGVAVQSPHALTVLSDESTRKGLYWTNTANYFDFNSAYLAQRFSNVAGRLAYTVPIYNFNSRITARGAGLVGASVQEAYSATVIDDAGVQEHNISSSSGGVVTTATTHSFLVGERVSIYDHGVGGYNDSWIVEAVTATTITLTGGGALGAGGASGKIRNAPGMYGGITGVNLKLDRSIYTGGAINDDDVGGWLVHNFGTKRATDAFYVGQSRSTVKNDFAVTADDTTEKFTTASAHGYRTGLPVTFSGTTMPGGITAGTTYYVIQDTTTTFKVATTWANSQSGTAVDLTSTGSGVTASGRKSAWTTAYTSDADVDYGFRVTGVIGADSSLSPFNDHGGAAFDCSRATRVGLANAIRLMSGGDVVAKNAAGTAFVNLIALNAADQITVGDFGSDNDLSFWRANSKVFSLNSSLHLLMASGKRIGFNVDPSAAVHFAASTVGTDGIQFGSDASPIRLYRSAANATRLEASTLTLSNNKNLLALNAAGSTSVNLVTLNAADQINVGSFGDNQLGFWRTSLVFYLNASDEVKLNTGVRFTGGDGIVVKTKSGVIADGDYTTPTDGMLGINESADTLAFRSNGGWITVGSGGTTYTFSDTDHIDHTLTGSDVTSLIKTTATPQLERLGIGVAASATARLLFPRAGTPVDTDGVWFGASNTVKLWSPAADVGRFDLTASATSGLTGIGLNSTAGGTSLAAGGAFLTASTTGTRLELSGNAATRTLIQGFMYTGSTLETTARVTYRLDGIFLGPGGGTAQDLAVLRSTTKTLSIHDGSSNGVTLNFPDGTQSAVIEAGTTNGLKIGSAATKLLGFYGKTPVDQPAAVADATTSVDVVLRFNELVARIRELGLIAT